MLEEAARPYAIDPRIELISAAFRLAGAPEFNAPPTSSYLAALDRLLAPLATHPIAGTIRELRRDNGIAYDAPISFAVNLDLATWTARGRFLDRRWKGAALDAFAQELRDFAARSRFFSFLEARAADAAEVALRVARALEGHDVVGWVTRCYGHPPAPTVVFVPALGIRPMSYQVRGAGAHGEISYQVISPCASGLEMAAVAAHELGHALVNPAVERHAPRFARSAAQVFAQVREDLARCGYQSWRQLVCESWVRAGAILFVFDEFGSQAAHALAREDADLGMPWTLDLAARLRGSGRRTLDAQAPIVAGVLDDYARTYCQSSSIATTVSLV